jgi:hypothetical protein
LRRILVLVFLLMLIAAYLFSRPHTIKALAPAPAPAPPTKLRHVVGDAHGNMIDAETGEAIRGSLERLSCAAPGECWVAIQ